MSKKTILLLAAIAAGLLIAAAGWILSPTLFSERTAGSGVSTGLASTPGSETSPALEASPAPTPDPSVEEGGVVNEKMTAAAPLPKIAKTPEPITGRNLNE